MANTRSWGFNEETGDLLRCSKKSLQQGLLTCFAFFRRVHNIHKLLGGPPEVLQLLLPPLLLLAQRLDLPKAISERFFSVSDYLLQPLDVICMAIQHILHVSKQLFFICYDFPKFCGEGIFRIQDKLLREKYSREERGLPWCAFFCSLSCSWSSRLRRSFLSSHVSRVRSCFSLSSSL
jgi:hypothetical protein